MDKPMNREEYKSNTEPKVGHLVRSCRDMEEGTDVLYRVQAVGLGRLGNKVYIRRADGTGEYGMELYYYCLAPQSEPKGLAFERA